MIFLKTMILLYYFNNPSNTAKSDGRGRNVSTSRNVDQTTCIWGLCLTSKSNNLLHMPHKSLVSSPSPSELVPHCHKTRFKKCLKG